MQWDFKLAPESGVKARKKIAARLEDFGFLEKIEPNVHMVPHGDRSNAVIDVVDAATGARTKVASGQSYGADWSPDGLWLIAKSELAGPDTDDAIVRADGTGLHLLTGFAGATW